MRQTVKKRTKCLFGTKRYDAEDYYRDKIIDLNSLIKKEKERKTKTNGGFGFVTFQSNL